MSNAPVRCERDHPNRCQGVGKGGQCPYLALEGFDKCKLHGSGSAAAAVRQQAKAYKLNQWQARVTDFAEHEAVKSLREEIGICRLLLETTLNLCQTPIELLQYHAKISDLVTKIEKLVGSCHRLEAATGALIDKSAALRLAADFVDVIGNYIEDPETLEKIGNQFVDLVAKAGKPVNEQPSQDNS